MLKTLREILDTHCICGSDDFSICENVGWDINEEAEEHQHLLVCNNCGRNTIACDVLFHSGKIAYTVGTFCYGERL